MYKKQVGLLLRSMNVLSKFHGHLLLNLKLWTSGLCTSGGNSAYVKDHNAKKKEQIRKKHYLVKDNNPTRGKFAKICNNKMFIVLEEDMLE